VAQGVGPEFKVQYFKKKIGYEKEFDNMYQEK
jgi:hypothetical protein